MPDARDHGAFVLSAILPDRRDLLAVASRSLTSEHFIDSSQAALFSLLQRYYDRTGGVLSESALEDLSRKIDSGRAQVYMETYLAFLETETSEEQFTWSVEQLREMLAERETDNAIVTAREILQRGAEVGGERMKGAEDARAYLSLSLGQIERQVTMQAAPEGDIRQEATRMLDDYAERKAIAESGQSRGILFGIENLDDKIGGLQRGEVVLIAGYSSDGKTTLLTQLAWDAVVEQGKNVVFFTTETLRDQVSRKVLARHSMHERFGLTAQGGINSYDIKNGTIPAALEGHYREVIADFTNNPDYGTFYIKQVPRGASLTYLEQSLASLHRKFPVDLVCMDYLALLAPERGRGSVREELASIMKDTKQVATSFGGGLGVPLVSPWQVSRAAREKAADVGKYTSASLSETAEATNTADIIVSIMAPIDNSERRVQSNVQVLKNRDGPTANDLAVQIDYGTSHFRGGTAFGGLQPTRATSSPAGGGDSILDDLIN